MSVSEHQLTFDVDALERLIGQPRKPHRVEPGPARLLAHLLARGLDERALTCAAALVLELDRHDGREESQ